MPPARRVHGRSALDGFRGRGLNRDRAERSIVLAAPTEPETPLPASGVLAHRGTLCTVEPVDAYVAGTNDQVDSSDECSRPQSETRAVPVRILHACVEPARRRRAAAAALRRDLVDQEKLSASAFDEAYAVARVTPGAFQSRRLMIAAAAVGCKRSSMRGLAFWLGDLRKRCVSLCLLASTIAFSQKRRRSLA